MKTRTPIYVYIISLLLAVVIVFQYFTGNSKYFSSPFFWMCVIISVVLLLITDSIGDLIENDKFKKLTDAEKQAYLAEKQVPYFKRVWNSAFKKQSASEEKDLIIDHGFDGITELDNSLPKWWLGLFYFGVVFCIVYVLAYSFTSFAHPLVEYDQEYKAQLASIEEYEKTAPAITVETAKYDPANIEEGKALFQSNCATCHGANGGGGIGPNLTDDYWINHSQSSVFKEVFWMAENGSPTNPTMRPLVKEGVISSQDDEKIAAYIYHINQELPPVTQAEGGAAPQGELVNWEANK